ncbi:MAG: radical SAM protein [Methanomassiliicoccales archaeon]|jgi:pyruvate formate-lyase activating enzyme-like uncharacterized protein|nr:radical SAM protein [Methanomassiliicoccales archaeon]
MKLKSLGAGSRYVGPLPEGCRICKEGAKLVLLVTGKCNASCYYCPLSLKKKGRDVIYANELKVRRREDVIEEAKLIDAEGTGITGGDPLLVLERTLEFISMLKDEFGQDHHIHLYTATIDREAFDALESAGLDELRIHPDISLWDKMGDTGIERAIESKKMKIGLEIPALPDKKDEIISLVTYADSLGMDFININELEFSETNWKRLKMRGFTVKDDLSSAIDGSEQLALEILKLDLSIPRHYCSSSFKDRIQLRNRIRRRAKNVARPGDIITGDGTLLKGIVEGKDLSKIREMLLDVFEVPDDLIHIDMEKKRVEVAPWVLEEISTSLPYDCYIVEEYPTADRLEVERERLPSRSKLH